MIDERESLTSNFVFSAIILWNPIPTPSMTASRQAHPIAEFLAALYPPRTASEPPVKNPAITVSMLAFFLLLPQLPSGCGSRRPRGKSYSLTSRIDKTYWHCMDPPSSGCPSLHNQTWRTGLPKPQSCLLTPVLAP
jgi:hypothetical protein